MANWAILTGMFSSTTCKGGAFAQLPTAHIDELLKRFERVTVKRGEAVIREGDEGDFYYVVESGRCQVGAHRGRRVDAAGRAEDAATRSARRRWCPKRSATRPSRMLDRRLPAAPGQGSDFNELLREPLLQSRRHGGGARQGAHRGAPWIDVRYPSEYQYDKLPGAINIPLAEVRNMFAVLDRIPEYVAYCQSGRRSAAAAFLLAQRGFKSFVLDGGLKGEAATADGSAAGT